MNLKLSQGEEAMLYLLESRETTQAQHLTNSTRSNGKSKPYDHKIKEEGILPYRWYNSVKTVFVIIHRLSSMKST